MALSQPDPSDPLPSIGTPRPKLSLVDSPPSGTDTGAVRYTACAWCERIRVAARWLEPGRALEQIQLDGSGELLITHGICPSCFDALVPAHARGR